MTPVIAIVGRPNVGKSTLYNRLTRSKQAIVHDRPGVTRDRLYGTAHTPDADEREVVCIDTGGFEPDPSALEKADLFQQVRVQAEAAIAEADEGEGENSTFLIFTLINFILLIFIL